MLVFINPASGNTRGPKLLARFRQALNPIQVFDLSKGNPVTGFVEPNTRMLCMSNRFRVC